MHSSENIRNIAIVAHVDHGKTTLVDGLLKQCQIFRENQDVPERVMDSYDQERERGITIFAKHTCIHYGDIKINIIDTPGHADFSSEVERTLGMVDTVLLVVDAQDGPMPQTRFVLSTALKLGLRPLVILNKIDRPHADADRVLNEVFDLFVELGATDEQLDFSHCYASAINGYAQMELTDPTENFLPLLDMIVAKVPPPSGSLDDPFLMQAATVTFDDFLGRQLSGKILQGSVRPGQQVLHLGRGDKESRHPITKVEGHLGLAKVEMEEAGVGDIVCLSGVPEVDIGDTLCDPEHRTKLPPIHIDEPTVAIEIVVNDGPFVGKSGKHVTMNKIRERLQKEARANLSYAISEAAGDQTKISVAGRGELHLTVLLEAMRREGFEFCVSRPQVIVKVIDGVKHEPLAKVSVDVPDEYSGSVIDQLSRRRSEMRSLETDDQGICHIEFLTPLRGLISYRNEFLMTTRGLGILTSVFEAYGPWRGDIQGRSRGVLVSMNAGKANSYASFNLKDRGELFTEPGDEVYEGMIVGEQNRENDLIVNLTKGKQLTNVRASGTDESLILAPPRRFSLEQAIGYINNDELLEVTPDAIRLRKRLLKEVDRKRGSR
jgi:GTP-binding protein